MLYGLDLQEPNVTSQAGTESDIPSTIAVTVLHLSFAIQCYYMN